MDYSIQEHGGRRVLPVPPGLRELASDLSREVLRAQPTNLFGFAADYLAAMLRARSCAVAAAETVGYMLENDVTFGALLESQGVDLEEATHACVVIQAAFRGFCTRRDLRESGALAAVDPVQRRYGVGRDVAERAIARIQAAFRGYLVRKILRLQQSGATAWLADDFPRSKIIQYLMRTVPPQVANAAATKIQAVFRGFSVRRALQQTIYEEVRREIFMGKTVVMRTVQKAKDYTLVAPEEIIEMGPDEPYELPTEAGEGATEKEGAATHGEEEEEEEEEEKDEEEEGEGGFDEQEAVVEGRPAVFDDEGDEESETHTGGEGDANVGEERGDEEQEKEGEGGYETEKVELSGEEDAADEKSDESERGGD